MRTHTRLVLLATTLITMVIAPVSLTRLPLKHAISKSGHQQCSQTTVWTNRLKDSIITRNVENHQFSEAARKPVFTLRQMQAKPVFRLLCHQAKSHFLSSLCTSQCSSDNCSLSGSQKYSQMRASPSLIRKWIKRSTNPWNNCNPHLWLTSMD